MSEKKIREKLAECSRRLAEEGLIKGTGGNISVKAGRFIYLSPSGFYLDKVKPNQYVKVNLDGRRVSKSSLSPSCELPLHLSSYRARADIRAVIHVHPLNTLALSCAGETVRAIFPDFAVLIGEKLPVIPYFFPGSELLGKKVGKVLKKNPAVLLRNHGLVAAGKNLDEAILYAEIIEEAARVYILSRQVGKVSFLSKKEVAALRERYKHA